jgi:DNA-binding PadR family transcriptional regulator
MATDALRYAVLGLISSRDQGIHGYQLKHDFDELYGEFWLVNYGQMYRMLDRLERAGLISGVEQTQPGRPNRKVFHVTDRGRRNLERWLLRPPLQEPLPLRDELSVRLLFLTEARVEETLTTVRSQRALYLQHLSRITKRRGRLEESGDQGFVASLLFRQADMRVRSDLAWLDVVEAEVQKRFARRLGERAR